MVHSSEKLTDDSVSVIEAPPAASTMKQQPPPPPRIAAAAAPRTSAAAAAAAAAKPSALSWQQLAQLAHVGIKMPIRQLPDQIVNVTDRNRIVNGHSVAAAAATTEMIQWSSDAAMEQQQPPPLTTTATEGTGNSSSVKPASAEEQQEKPANVRLHAAEATMSVLEAAATTTSVAAGAADSSKMSEGATPQAASMATLSKPSIVKKKPQQQPFTASATTRSMTSLARVATTDANNKQMELTKKQQQHQLQLPSATKTPQTPMTVTSVLESCTPSPSTKTSTSRKPKSRDGQGRRRKNLKRKRLTLPIEVTSVLATLDSSNDQLATPPLSHSTKQQQQQDQKSCSSINKNRMESTSSKRQKQSNDVPRTRQSSLLANTSRSSSSVKTPESSSKKQSKKSSDNGERRLEFAGGSSEDKNSAQPKSSSTNASSSKKPVPLSTKQPAKLSVTNSHGDSRIESTSARKQLQGALQTRARSVLMDAAISSRLETPISKLNTQPKSNSSPHVTSAGSKKVKLKASQTREDHSVLANATISSRLETPILNSNKQPKYNSTGRRNNGSTGSKTQKQAVAQRRKTSVLTSSSSKPRPSSPFSIKHQTKSDRNGERIELTGSKKQNHVAEPSKKISTPAKTTTNRTKPWSPMPLLVKPTKSSSIGKQKELTDSEKLKQNAEAQTTARTTVPTKATRNTTSSNKRFVQRRRILEKSLSYADDDGDQECERKVAATAARRKKALLVLRGHNNGSLPKSPDHLDIATHTAQARINGNETSSSEAALTLTAVLSAIRKARRQGRLLPDGFVVPKRNTDRNRNGAFPRPKGRSLAGFYWHELRGQWAPDPETICLLQNGQSSDRSASKQPRGRKEIDRKTNSPSAPESNDDYNLDDNKGDNTDQKLKKQHVIDTYAVQTWKTVNSAIRENRLLKDGSILPKTPTKRGADGKFAQPVDSSLFGFYWNGSKGSWKPKPRTIVWLEKGSLPPVKDSRRDGPVESDATDAYVIQTWKTVNVAIRENRWLKDGSILPKTPTNRGSDGKFAQPVDSSLFGFYWNGSKGRWSPKPRTIVWLENGSLPPVKNSRGDGPVDVVAIDHKHQRVRGTSAAEFSSGCIDNDSGTSVGSTLKRNRDWQVQNDICKVDSKRSRSVSSDPGSLSVDDRIASARPSGQINLIVPRGPRIQRSDGTFARPRGRAPGDYDWNEYKGCWELIVAVKRQNTTIGRETERGLPIQMAKDSLKRNSELLKEQVISDKALLRLSGGLKRYSLSSAMSNEAVGSIPKAHQNDKRDSRSMIKHHRRESGRRNENSFGQASATLMRPGDSLAKQILQQSSEAGLMRQRRRFCASSTPERELEPPRQSTNPDGFLDRKPRGMHQGNMHCGSPPGGVRNYAMSADSRVMAPVHSSGELASASRRQAATAAGGGFQHLYSPCGVCAGCKTKENCSRCLPCLLRISGAAQAESTCYLRICTQPVIGMVKRHSGGSHQVAINVDDEKSLSDASELSDMAD